MINEMYVNGVQVRLVSVDETNWRMSLHVGHGQEKFVANTAVILARAYAYRNLRSQAFLIYADETPVGMGLYYDCPELDAYDFSQLLIDERYQGRGYGKAAAKLVLDTLKHDGVYQKVVLCYVEGNDTAKRLYEQLGFVETGQEDDEIGMELSF